MRVLAIGTVTLDIVNSVDRYPSEDEELRATSQHRVRGGNAANTLVVLSQLGHQCVLGAVLAGGEDARYIVSDLLNHQVDTSACVHCPESLTPTSYVLLNRTTGSRTIVHHRDLREFTAADFKKIGLEDWDWIHFEARVPGETVRMLEHVERFRPDLACSVEVEKPRPGIEQLFSRPDVLLFSRAYARAKGFRDGPALLRAMRQNTGRASLFCAWGDHGAYAMNGDGRCFESSAFPPKRVVDTLGAGDVFNAAVIDGLHKEQDIEQVLTHACRLAGKKCGLVGFDGIDEGQAK